MNKLSVAKYALICGLGVSASGAVYGQAGQNGPQLLSQQPRTLLTAPSAGCSVGQLNLRITTGNDDLRGGKNNLDVEVHYANGDMQVAPNVNKGENWPNQSVKTVGIPLKHPVAPGDIKQIHLVHSAQGGYVPPSAFQAAGAATPAGAPAAPIYAVEGIKTEDNWDMAEFQAFGIGNGTNIPIASFGAHRFTGSDPALDINAHAGAGCPGANQVTRVSFTFATSDDDLRGGNDNLNVEILFLDGSRQIESNVNRSQNWPNGSTKGVEILLNRPVDMNQIRGFLLADTFGGGSGGDNWNMASMEADAFLADGSHHTLAKSGFHRFSADMSGPAARQIMIQAHPIN